jgi:hypothetical protein
MNKLFENGNLDSIKLQGYADTLNSDQKRILLPSFQRDAVWDEKRVELLWDSILRRYPIGSLLFARVRDDIAVRLPPRFVGLIPRETAAPADETEFVIIDGQQRSVAIALGRRCWQSGDSARLWIDIGKLSEKGALKSGFYVCSLRKPWGVDATLAMQRKALTDLDPAAERLVIDEDVLGRTWPVRASLPVPFAELLNSLENPDRDSWWLLIPKTIRDGLSKDQIKALARDDLQKLFDAMTEVLTYSIPVFMVEGLKIDELGEVFHRLNKQGVAMNDEDLFFSALKIVWPQAHDLVWTVYADDETGKFMPPTKIVHLGVRTVAADSESDVSRLSRDEFKRFVEREDREGVNYLAKLQELLDPTSSRPESIGILHDCLRKARKTLEYDPESSTGINDPGMPSTLLKQLSWRVWHTLVAWIVHHGSADEESRGEMIRYAMLDYFCTKGNSSTLAHEPFRLAFNADGIFPGRAIYRMMKERGYLQPAIPTPEDYRAHFRRGRNERPAWGLLQHESRLVMWAQRRHFHQWFPEFDPTLYILKSDLPYHVDHIIPRSYLSMRGRNMPPPPFELYRRPVLYGAGNIRYWPKALNLADGAKNLRDKYILGRSDRRTPSKKKSDLRKFGLKSVADVRAASFILDNQLRDWRIASNHGGGTKDFSNPGRIRAFRRATEKRRIAMYDRFYKQVGWEDWLDKTE